MKTGVGPGWAAHSAAIARVVSGWGRLAGVSAAHPDRPAGPQVVETACVIDDERRLLLTLIAGGCIRR